MDFDYVTLSSLNRHATATLADVGTPKVKCVEKFLKGVAPWADVDACVDIWRKEEGGELLDGYDWVVGAYDFRGRYLTLTLGQMPLIISRPR